jgi:hypothetical protein
MTTDQNTQEDINARLAMISKAVEEKLHSKQQTLSEAENVGQEQNTLAASACPIDPMERLLCDSCQ